MTTKEIKIINLDLRIDVESLINQKALLLGLLNQDTLSFSKDEVDCIDGILNHYDYIMDLLVEEHGYTEEEIFGKLIDD